MKMSSRSKAFVLLLSLALTSVGIEIARADTYTWTQISNANIPTASGNATMAMSSDGSTMIVGRQSEGVYISTNSGTTFTKISTSFIPNAKYFVAISADGTQMLASSADSAATYVSTDRGQNWASKTVQTAGGVCMSGDGSVWAIGANLGVWISTNNGSTWTKSGSFTTGPWACAMSYDASKRYFVRFGTSVQYTTNSGSTWNTTTGIDSSAGYISLSNDASVIILIAVSAGKVYLSSDLGSTFALKYTGSGGIYGNAVSYDGTKVVVTVLNGKVIVSLDGGNTWNADTSSPSLTTLAMNSAGTKILGGNSSTGVTAYLGNFPQPASVTLQSISPNASPLIYRTSYTLNVLSNTAGKVTFYANGKKITKCSQVPTVSLVATCVYAPSIHGVITLTAYVASSDAAFFSATSTFLRTSAIVRTTRR